MSERGERVGAILSAMDDTLDLPPPKQAAVSYITREDGRLLVVWNKRYGGWSMPGGLREGEESIEEAQERELLEETGCRTVSQSIIFQGPITDLPQEVNRATELVLFKVQHHQGDIPAEMELGCPVTWLTREEFMKWSPFSAFYRKVFEVLDALKLG